MSLWDCQVLTGAWHCWQVDTPWHRGRLPENAVAALLKDGVPRMSPETTDEEKREEDAQEQRDSFLLSLASIRGLW